MVAHGWLHLKGAPDSVLPRCVNPQGAKEAVQHMAACGLRVIAIARRSLGQIVSTRRHQTK